MNPLDIARLNAAALVGLDCVQVTLSLEDGLELHFVDKRSYLGEAVKVTFMDWHGLSVTDDLGQVSSCDCVRTEARSSEYRLHVQFRSGESHLEVSVAGQYQLNKSDARAY